MPDGGEILSIVPKPIPYSVCAMADPTETPVLDSTKALGEPKVSDCLSQEHLWIVNFIIFQMFGEGYDLDRLEAELENIRSDQFVDDATVVTMALIYAHFMRKFLNDPVAADLLLYYLNQQSPTTFKPTAITITPLYEYAIIPLSSVRTLKEFDSDVMINVMTDLERAIQKRFENPTVEYPVLNYGPVQTAYFHTHDEAGIQVTPAISALPAGGTETIYGQSQVTLRSNEYSVGTSGGTIAGIPKGIVQALGKVTINFKAKVTSTVVDADKKWTVNIDEGEYWLEDDGNFIDGHVSKGAKYLDEVVTNGVDMLKNSDDRWAKFAAYLISENCPPLVSLLDRLSITDMFMDMVKDKTVTINSGATFRPREFKILTEPWPMTQPGPQFFKTEYTVDP